MDATSQLEVVARALAEQRLDAILIGCAAAALQGAPVTTEDFDFYFRPTRRNLKKLEAVAALLGGSLERPYYPLSGMYRIVGAAVQVDMMSSVLGVRSYEGVRSRATSFSVGSQVLKVASLRDVVTMKEAADRPKDRAVLPTLRSTLREAEEE
jgi:predicted nucleotidyltransferase